MHGVSPEKQIRLVLGFHFAGAGLAGYEAGGEDDGDEGQSDEQIVHLSFSLSGAFTAALLTLLESLHYQNRNIPLPLRFSGRGWDTPLPPMGYSLK